MFWVKSGAYLFQIALEIILYVIDHSLLVLFRANVTTEMNLIG